MTRTLGILSVIIATVGCQKTDSESAFVEIDAMAVAATDEQGGGTSKITDVWVTVDERSLGVWELPARIPVLANGEHTIGITGGVKRNGSFDDRLRYPYYTRWSGPAMLEQGGTLQLSPVVAYQPASFWLEQFNDAGSQLITSEQSDTTLLIISPTAEPGIVLDGTQCGGFVLDAAHPYIALMTDADLPGTSGPVYLEMDYSTDIELTIGFAYVQDGIAQSEPWVVLVPTASEGSISWNKVYVDLTAYFATGGLTGRDIYIGSQLPSGRTRAAAYFDNVKIVRPST